MELFILYKSYLIKTDLVNTCLMHSFQWLYLFGGISTCSLPGQREKYMHIRTDTQRKLAEKHKIKHLFKNVI